MSVGVTKDYKLKVNNLHASHTLGWSSPCHALISPVFESSGRIFFKVKTSFPTKPLAGLAGHQRWGMEECAARLVQTFPDLQKNWSIPVF